VAWSADQMTPDEDWWMEVVDEGGLVLFRLNFLIVASATVLGSGQFENSGPMRKPRNEGS
jgi:hypothetical protein